MRRQLAIILLGLLSACASRPANDLGPARDGGLAPNVDLGDPCLRGNGGCDERASCASALGVVTCTCPDGLLGSGVECVEPARRSGAGEVRPMDTGSVREFGVPLAMSRDGLTLAVADTTESSDSSGVDAMQTGPEGPASGGAVWVFRWVDGRWVLDAFIKAFNPGPGDFYGFALALSDDGTTLAVGAPREDTTGFGVDPEADDPPVLVDNQSEFDTGAVYVYRRRDSGWAREAFIKPQDNAFRINSFGLSLTMSGDGSTLGVGAAAPGIQIHVREGTTWRYVDSVDASILEFGSVALSAARFNGDGDVLAVGHPWDDTNGAGVNPMPTNVLPASGAARVFRRVGDSWQQEAYIKAPSPGAANAFGTAVSLSTDGTVLAVLAPGEAGSGSGVNPEPDQTDGFGNSGAAYIYRYADGVWAFEAYIKALPNDPRTTRSLLETLDLSGDGRVLALGAPADSSGLGGLHRDPSGELRRSGAVLLFRRDAGGWFYEARLKDDVPMPRVELGASLSFDHTGRRLAVGAREDEGRVTIFDLDY